MWNPPLGINPPAEPLSVVTILSPILITTASPYRVSLPAYKPIEDVPNCSSVKIGITIHHYHKFDC